MDALQQLRDLHLPTAPGWWPPAPGWWLVALLLVAAAVWLMWYWLQRRARHRPFHHARVELQRLVDARRAGSLDPAAFADANNALLKRLHIHALQRPDMAALDGTHWLDVIDHHIPDARQRQIARDAFGPDRFRRDFQTDTDVLVPLTLRLIRRLEAVA